MPEYRFRNLCWPLERPVVDIDELVVDAHEQVVGLVEQGHRLLRQVGLAHRALGLLLPGVPVGGEGPDLLLRLVRVLEQPAGRLGVDHIDYTISPDVERKFMYKALVKTGSTGVPMHMAIYSIPLRIAVALEVPLVVWGENPHVERSTH